MAAKPKLTSEEWDKARKVWESDPRKGFPWLIDELNLPVSAEALRLRSKQEGWVKGGVDKKPSLDNKKTKLGKTQKPSLEKGAPKHVKKAHAIQDAEWEEVDEKAEKLHGNSKYDQRFDEQAYKLCLLGATDEELGDFFHVDESTINRWKISFPSFCESLNRGKVAADAEAAASLFKRACGYRYTEVKTKEVLAQEEDTDGNIIDGELKAVEIVSTVKEVPPDTGAAFIWLKNRRGKDWKDKQEIEINNKLGPELLSRLESDMIKRMEASRERQRTVLLERGIVAEQ